MQVYTLFYVYVCMGEIFHARVFSSRGVRINEIERHPHLGKQFHRRLAHVFTMPSESASTPQPLTLVAILSKLQFIQNL